MDILGRGLDCDGGSLGTDSDTRFINGSLLMSGNGTEGDGGDLDVSAVTLIRQTADRRSRGRRRRRRRSPFSPTATSTSPAPSRRTAAAAPRPGSTFVELNAKGRSPSREASTPAAARRHRRRRRYRPHRVQGRHRRHRGVTSLGDTGDIRVEAHDKLTLRGIFQAGSGGISVQYGPRAVPPTVNASFSPATVAVLNPFLVPCRVCDTNAECNDGNSCTDDACPPTAPPASTRCARGSCSDDNACTVGDTCSAGVCIPGPAPNCADTNTCTIDSLSPQHRLHPLPDHRRCDDGNSCTTNDHCVIGVCQGTAPNCDDHNPCTDDTCNGSGGCIHTPNTSPCTDNNPCTTGDACANGACGGTPVTCNDHDPCTTDSCAQSSRLPVRRDPRLLRHRSRRQAGHRGRVHDDRLDVAADHAARSVPEGLRPDRHQAGLSRRRAGPAGEGRVQRRPLSAAGESGRQRHPPLCGRRHGSGVRRQPARRPRV